MNQLIFQHIDNSGNITDTNQTIKLEVNVPEDMNIYTLHRMCKSFAVAMTYPESLVDEVFGETNWDI
jgi:hypothetical protein